MFDIVIIGAGASGLFCWSLLPKNMKKLILEKTANSWTKVLLSGKGRCNFTNINTTAQHYLGDQKERVDQLFETFWPKEMISFLEKNDIATQQEENGRVLLASNKSRQLVDFLIQKNQENWTEIRTEQEVLSIQKENEIFLISTPEKTYLSKKVILATGGCSFPKIGASSFIFDVAERYQLKTKAANPALCGISTKEKLETLSGSSVVAELQLINNGKTAYSSKGNLLFTHWGISGPLVFNASLFLGYYHPDQLKKLKIKLIIPCDQMTKRLHAYLKAPKNLKSYTISLTPLALRSRDEAKVMSGGVCFEEVKDSFELKKLPWCYILGEALNITGETGGFNLQRCRTSAYHCAKGIEKT